jgi:hypothetical protein
MKSKERFLSITPIFPYNLFLSTMKKVLFSIATVALFTVGCSSNTNEAGHEHGPDSHEHGTEEAHGHPHNSDGSHPHEQEEFTVEGDTIVTKTTTKETHSHDGQEDHKH